jgi:hypothetical protein
MIARRCLVRGVTDGAVAALVSVGRERVVLIAHFQQALSYSPGHGVLLLGDEVAEGQQVPTSLRF